MTAYVLTDDAEADLRSVIRYSRRQWGDAQARRYVTTMQQEVDRLVAGHSAAKDMGDLYPSLRMGRCGHHYVFFLPAGNSPTLVVAIFHERMDLMTRVAARLGV
ncbi:type II toxin-antitoxin system RelE/ParE family toxin [Stenotrophomonas maltophilia]|uniref:type II toxin-antitoxin system RelE/ParE family toxin n=1 Tax=Stenotrophomonas maltophilia TaxID=40324 RepID=UPI000DA79C59|nr:type II toxin-antitoxin system RelE/ParE family toxin [Stenotrophomonas maltophilia]PZT16795.1 plasmid stabilization protein ParE [Stenotrophomonas maltophilia]UVH75382.1 type II toxin-antitoxin system RelE/ParE family toxin [Stenotrophomonas maltophilia]HDS1667651.1 type II toxin-antitoxin system RelE/ParE family toxin [Stenotrophomonas maltophilia]